jgi:HEPN domain-containing protein
MLSAAPPVTDTACFHAQQCVEKCLKAFLTAKGKHIEKTHSLPRLVEMCGDLDKDFEKLKETSIELTDYAVVVRYPDDWRDITVEETESAAKRAKAAMEFVRSKLSVLEMKNGV